MPNNTAEKMNSERFCDLHGIDKIHRHTILFVHKPNELKTYDEWFDTFETNFSLTNRKVFDVKEEIDESTK